MNEKEKQWLINNLLDIVAQINNGESRTPITWENRLAGSSLQLKIELRKDE